MRRLLVALAGAASVAIVIAAGAPAEPARVSEHMDMVGNTGRYPDLAAAGPRNVARARRVLRASRRAARQFDTLAEAEARGYAITKLHRPGFTHARKHNTLFWGRMFDPDAPQALVFWCPSRGACRLAADLYRAPAGRAPSTWGDLLMWHRHAPIAMATWMTHVWLVRGLRTAYATCAPIRALERDRMIQPEPYDAQAIMRPCTGKAAMPDM